MGIREVMQVLKKSYLKITNLEQWKPFCGSTIDTVNWKRVTTALFSGRLHSHCY